MRSSSFPMLSEHSRQTDRLLRAYSAFRGSGTASFESSAMSKAQAQSIRYYVERLASAHSHNPACRLMLVDTGWTVIRGYGHDYGGEELMSANHEL